MRLPLKKATPPFGREHGAVALGDPVLSRHIELKLLPRRVRIERGRSPHRDTRGQGGTSCLWDGQLALWVMSALPGTRLMPAKRRKADQSRPLLPALAIGLAG